MDSSGTCCSPKVYDGLLMYMMVTSSILWLPQVYDGSLRYMLVSSGI